MRPPRQTSLEIVSSATENPGGEDRIVEASLALLNELGPALQSDDRARIVAIVAQLIELKAPVGQQWRALAQLAARNGEIGLALRAIDLFVEVNGGRADAIYDKSALLEQTGRLRQGYELLLSLGEDKPSPAANAYSRGTAALFLGEAEEARRQLERATTLQPHWGAAWLSLAMAVELGDAPELGEQIVRAASAMRSAPPEQQAPACYAAGKVEAELGRHDQAFAFFERGAKLARSLYTYDRMADLRDVKMRSPVTKATWRRGRAQNPGESRTIFVTGLPRSGTTLVEQILTAHEDVAGGAEVDRLPLLAQELRGRSPGALSTYEASNGLGQAARLWNHWMRERFGEHGRVVDKSLTTPRFLGLASAVLPNDPIIWMVRDPLDCAFSCYRVFFEGRFPWSYDLADIAWHFRLSDQLRCHWQNVLGDRLLVVPYQELVTQPSDWIRRILAHCGLSEQPQVFEPHRNRRPVATASVAQVRNPISRSAVGSAQPYAQYLGAFSDAYEASGYDARHHRPGVQPGGANVNPSNSNAGDTTHETSV